ncbi:MAG: hypothetical protein U0457_15440 [Candidatus Sericytochromatia bacterium]
MTINKPFPLMYRPGPPNTLAPFYEETETPEAINNLSSYNLLKNDLRQIFEFIEPDPINETAFSHRTFELLLRACTEVESLCKQIFERNGHSLNHANIIRYSDLEGAMKLSEYKVKSYGFIYPIFSPFESFNDPIKVNRSPQWYKDYNSVKHNRFTNFSKCSLKNVIYSVGGVYVLLVAMYGIGFDHNLKYSYNLARMVDTPSFFRVLDYPQWPISEQYNYNWDNLKTEPIPFQNHPIPVIQ